MGRRGPRPTPTALRIVKGNPGRRPLNRREARPGGGLPTAPAMLDDVGRREWRRVVRKLAAIGLVTTLDRSVLAVYCLAWATIADCQAKIKQFGSILKSPSGFPVLSPYVPQLNQAVKQLMAAAAELGMTPSSRSRIDIGDQAPPVDALAEFQRRRD